VRVRRLSLVDFRSYATAEIDFAPGPNVLVGRNGQGKTNVLEALGYVATLGSHRVSGDAPLVRAGAERAVVRSLIEHEGRELLVELEITPGKANRARLNRVPVPRAREIVGALRTVLFAPEDVAIVRGDPSERRRFLDELLVLRHPRFAGVRADYERVLRQRNALLKSAGGGRRRVDLSTLDAWDHHLVQHGAELLVGRLELTAALRPHVSAAYDAVAGTGSGVAMTYSSALLDGGSTADDHEGVSSAASVPVEEVRGRFAAALSEVRDRELERGITLVGPQRDDLLLALRDLPARGYASHGETWSFALALKLGSYELLRSDGAEPVLLLDDVFAELDAGRRDQLAAIAASAGQALITAAVAEDVPAELGQTRFSVADGEVRRGGV
jgi:DNA replication and repair protein RecF